MEMLQAPKGPCLNCGHHIVSQTKECPECSFSHPSYKRATGMVCYIYGIGFMLTIIGIPLGMLLIHAGQRLRYPVDFDELQS